MLAADGSPSTSTSSPGSSVRRWRTLIGRTSDKEIGSAKLESGNQLIKKESSTSLSSVKEDEEEEGRDKWTNPAEFLLSCIAMSVGLGNIWRFPYIAYTNGGGAFLIPYIVVLSFIGRPLYFLEMILGQFSSSGSVKVWNVVPFARGIGYGQAMATWCVVTYYVYLMALAIYYLFCSFQDPLPWTFCNPQWADMSTCYGTSGNHSGLNVTGKTSSSEQFFKKYVLKEWDNLDSGIGSPEWTLSICLLISWILIFAILVKGVASSGKVAYFTALFPYAVLITLLIRGATLPGAAEGILFFVKPQWDKVLTVQVWYAAVTQCFFSLSVGFGPIINFASYNPFRHPIYRDATIVSFADTGTSILAGITIFSILGNLAHETGQLDNIDKIVRGGTGLAFVSYPEAISKFDAIPQFFAVLFFLMLITLAIGSATGLTGCVITIICDDFPQIERWIITAIVCILSFLVGLVYVTPGGQYIFDLMDYFGGGFIIYVIVIFQTVLLFWVYGLSNIVKDVRFMLGFGISIYWKLTWAIIIPIALLVIFVYAMIDYQPMVTDNGKPYPAEDTAAGWLVAAIAILQIPGWGLWVVYKQEGSTWIEKWKSSFRPSDEWGPVNLKLKREWLKYNQVAPPFSWIPKICRRSNRTELSIPSEELDDRDTTQIVHDYSKRSKSRTKQEEQDPNPDERLV